MCLLSPGINKIIHNHNWRALKGSPRGDIHSFFKKRMCFHKTYGGEPVMFCLKKIHGSFVVCIFI